MKRVEQLGLNTPGTRSRLHGGRFNCCDDILVKGRGYMNQSKSVLLMALVFPLKMEGERSILRVEAEIRYQGGGDSSVVRAPDS